jgi:hypothetical protein
MALLHLVVFVYIWDVKLEAIIWQKPPNGEPSLLWSLFVDAVNRRNIFT